MFLLNDTTHRMTIRHDPDIGHRFVPNLRARLLGGDGGHIIRTNSLGFRSNHEFASGGRSRPRILIFGDSYTAGDNVANEDRFSDRLAEILDAEVFNYGIPGTGTDQHLLVYRKFAREVSADLVMVCVYIDSFHRIQMTHRPAISRFTGKTLLVPKPYFTLEDGGLKLHQVPVPTERREAETSDKQTTRKQDAWVQSVLKWYHRVPGLREIRHSRPLNEVGSRLISTLYRLRDEQPYEDITSPDSPGWQLMSAILRQFVEEARPTPVLIVPIPTQSFYRHGVKAIYQPLFETLEDTAGGVHVGDVTTPLASLPWSERQKLSFDVGGHFTPMANNIVAEAMAAAIRQRELLPREEADAAPSPAAKTSPPPRVHSQAGSKNILGISCFYHNSAAAFIRDGQIVAAAEEERFTRVKNDRRFPHFAVNFCLEEAEMDQRDLDAIVFYDNSSLTFERLCHSIMAVDREAAKRMWMKIMPSWLRLKLHFPQMIREQLRYEGLVLQGAHHRSHAASCFFPSPFDEAAILTIDGVGEWSTASIGRGNGRQLNLLKEMDFPHSVGLLYSAFTQFTGFKVNSGEYKMMGLAPYGEPIYAQRILEHLVDLKPDGSIQLNLDYFGFLHDTQMTNDRFAELFDGPRRQPDSRITRREMDIARSIQEVVEQILLKMAAHAHELTGLKKLCMAGGVALNCVANGRLLREGPFDELWIQPAAGDSGCALGAALDAYHSHFGEDRTENGVTKQGGSTLGPAYSDSEIAGFLETFGYPYRKLHGDQRDRFLTSQLQEGRVVGHFTGRLEYGPRSLGARSILGDPRNTEMQTELNLRIKYRESFRPFAPAVLRERVQDYFELDAASPYMLIVAPVREERRIAGDDDTMLPDDEDMLRVVRRARSDLPAITHVDYSARVQTVTEEDHPKFYRLLKSFERTTDCGVLVNTSFNVRGEPIVCTPQDAYRCFMRTEMDVLALEDYILVKGEQPAWPEPKAEGLESEDAPKSADPETHPVALLQRLEKLFNGPFWQLAGELQAAGHVRVQSSGSFVTSMWRESEAPEDLSELFAFPDALSSTTGDAKTIASAICQQWLYPDVAEQLRTVVSQLIEVGLKHPVESELAEEVSESVYVMF